MLLVAISGCTSQSRGTGPDSGFIAGDGSTQLIARDERGQSVDLSGVTLQNEPLDIKTWRGRFIVVNLWASWCGPCRAEAVNLERIYQQFRKQNVEFLGINTRDGLAAARAFNKRFDTGYPSLQDRDGRLTLAFGNLGPAATPSTIILDEQGRVAARMLGPVTQAQLRSVLRAVIPEDH